MDQIERHRLADELKGRFAEAFPCVCHAGFQARGVTNPACAIHPIEQIMREVFGE